MEDYERKKIYDDYLNRIYLSIYVPFKLMGVSRFDIENGRVGKKSLSSVLISLLILTIINSCTLFLIYKLAILKDYLMTTEVLILLNFLVFHNVVIFNSSFVNKRSAVQFLNDVVKIDYFFGADETLVMREITSNVYYCLCLIVGLTQIVMLLILLISYMGDIYVYVTGAVLFTILYFIYYDLSFFISLYTIITLRVRYLNVAIMKLANVNLEYLPHQHPFNSMLWNEKYDDLVGFHKKAKLEDFTQAFTMLFSQLRYLEDCYRFTIFCSLCYLTAGTFIAVQNMIIYAKTDADIDPVRVAALTGWCIQSWLFQVGISQQTGMFHRQINQTNLICTYIQLKPTYSDEIYKLTEDIMRTLEIRDPRMSIYGIFYYDTGLLLRFTSSIFVYITIQLQLATAKTSDVIIVDNSTSTKY